MKLKHTQATEPSDSVVSNIADIISTSRSGGIPVNGATPASSRLAGIITANPANGYVKDVGAASFLNCSVSRLRQDRFHCRGLPYYRYGRSILYKISDIEAYLEKTKVVPVENF